MRIPAFKSSLGAGDCRAGFTLGELLVVIVVSALLALMILPGLARTKSDSRGFQCLNNNRELNRAWRMWTDDNNDLLLYSSHAGNRGPNDQRAWVVSELDFSSNRQNWDTAVSIEQSPMWPYGKSDTTIWRCPSDESYVLVNGEPKPRIRSYSMNFYLGGFAGDSSGAYWWVSSYRLYFKSSDITVPAPDRLFVFLDQRPDSINWGNFAVFMHGYSPSNPALYRFGPDLPGYYHDGGASFSYADGHGEIHRWQDPRTMPPLKPYGQVIDQESSSPNNPDIAWLQDRAMRPK